MWLCIKSILIRMYVKICVCYVCCCVPCIAMRMAFNLALRMFCRLGSLSAIQRLLAGQYTHEPVVLLMPFSYHVSCTLTYHWTCEWRGVV
jgi:hypothetical protein